jgi:hypothetical protein
MDNHDVAELEFLRILKKMPGDGQFFHFNRTPDHWDSDAQLTLDVVTWSEFIDQEFHKNIETGTLRNLILVRMEHTCDDMIDKALELIQIIKGIKDATKKKQT